MGSTPGRNAWLSAALLCVAMLIVPLAGWLLFPKRSTPSHARSAPAATSKPGATDLARPGDPRPSGEGPGVRSNPQAERGPQDETSVTGNASVSGVVLDPEGTPVSRASIGCEDRGEQLTTATDEEGRFNLAPEAAGCSAVARHPSFSPSERVRLTAGDRNTLRLSRGGAIAGTVLDESGTPVPSYLLALESFMPSASDGPSPPMGRPRTIADPGGQFLLEGLPPGRYVLTASAEGRPPARSGSIEVEPSRTTHHVRITLARGATLVGTVTDADTRQPVVGARVALDAMTSTGANAIGSAVSDATGAYALPGVPPGPFSVRFAREGYRTKIVAGLTTRGAPSIREDVALTPRGDGGSGDSELVGIGAVLSPSPAGVVVASLIEDGPAARAGLQRGDRFVRIDGADATSMPLSDCVQRLRGPEGSRVTIAVEREGRSQVELTVVRAMIVR